jgi:ubiquinol-cytochrome c reductase iron-sulfur subunit
LDKGSKTVSDTQTHDEETTRRDFIHIAAATAAAGGVVAVAWPLITQMNPAADVLALAELEVDLSKIALGTQLTVMWRGRPVIIRHRTEKEIEEARAVKLAVLKDPQTDDERLVPNQEGVKEAQFLIMEGNCTHLGCVPVGNGAGDYDGWFCPCHGSHYDSSGRIRKGPAPKNLYIPPYTFIAANTIVLGKENA